MKQRLHGLRLAVIKVLRGVYKLGISAGRVSPDGAVDVEVYPRPVA